jgi:hypothetical protein
MKSDVAIGVRVRMSAGGAMRCARRRRKATALKRGYISGIVTPIFKPFQRIENRHHGWLLADETNDSAHLLSPFSPLSDCGIELMPTASNHRACSPLPIPKPFRNSE